VSSCELGTCYTYQTSVHSHIHILSALGCGPEKYKLKHKTAPRPEKDKQNKECTKLIKLFHISDQKFGFYISKKKNTIENCLPIK
jgi:hypothetical protein